MRLVAKLNLGFINYFLDGKFPPRKPLVVMPALLHRNATDTK